MPKAAEWSINLLMQLILSLVVQSMVDDERLQKTAHTRRHKDVPIPSENKISPCMGYYYVAWLRLQIQ